MPPQPSRWGFGVLLGGEQLSPFPISPGVTYRKKKQEIKQYKCLQSTLSAVPLTLWMPNRHKKSRSSPGTVGRRGGRNIPLPLALFNLSFYSFFGARNLASSIHRSHVHLAGVCFFFGGGGGVFASCPFPGSSPLAAGSDAKAPGRFWLGGRCRHPLPALPHAL